jgi:dipeptidyl aminopeptidase/acylaminoacyl peptidase
MIHRFIMSFVILSAALTVVMSVPADTTLAADTGSGYVDVPQEHYAKTQINIMSQRGIIQGNEDGSFHPDEEVTRGVTALWLSRALKLGKPAALDAFTDVPKTSEYAIAVNALSEQGIVQGEGGKFAPNDPLTREQMASLLARAFKLKDNGMNVWFRDESAINDSHYDDVIRLKQYFLTDQIDYMPKNKVTRAQLVLFLYRAVMIGEPERGELPLEEFLKGSELSGFQTSPDGKMTALMKEDNNHTHLFVFKKGEERKDAVRITELKERDIESFFWFDTTTLVYITSLGGDENYHIHSVQADGQADRDLTPFDKVRVNFMEDISYKRGNENDVLISMNYRSKDVFDVYTVNVKNGDLKIITNNPGNITRYMTDLYSNVSLAMATEGVQQKLLYKAPGVPDFSPILTIEAGDTFEPIMFSFDNTQLFALSNIGRDTLALVTFYLNTKEIAGAIYENPAADVTDIVVSYRKKAILAVQYETDKVHYHYLDKEYEQLNNEIAAKLPAGLSYRIVGNPLPDRFVTVRAYSDKLPGTYYFYDRTKKELEKYADVKPWIKEDQMADMKPISYTSRDNRTINGYLTLPNKILAGKPPLVVLPHGGPWSRDSWEYDTEVQLLANRGYAVLQVNFRGSTGYGKSFGNAGNKQWGQAMQNDITDGVHWVINQGMVDPDRIAIFGASYGGYAALAGATYTPELYKAAIDYMGPSSLFTFLESMPSYWEPDRQIMYMQVGDPVKDKEMLEAYSPVLHADKIKAPILFVQGVNDPRVNKKESDQMVIALRNRGVDSHYLIKYDEGHGFHKFENRVDLYNSVLKFLNIHLMQ